MTLDAARKIDVGGARRDLADQVLRRPSDQRGDRPGGAGWPYVSPELLDKLVVIAKALDARIEPASASWSVARRGLRGHHKNDSQVVPKRVS
jgi:hypothetical protein